MTFQQILLRRGIRFRTSGTDNLKTHINCPFCIERGKGPDTGFRLCVHASQGWGRCMRCDWKRRFAAMTVLRELRIYEEISGIEVGSAEEVIPISLPADFQCLTRTFDDLDKMALRYVRSRGVTVEQIRECRIGVSYIGDYAYRIVFPVYVGKTLKGINARDFTGHRQPKYLNSKGDKYLFHFDSTAKVCVLSEGVFKALRIAQVTKFCSASMLGNTLSQTMIEQIKTSKCEEIILYPDPDVAGRTGFLDTADNLNRSWQGVVKIAAGVNSPADEDSLTGVAANLANLADYNCKTHAKLAL